MLNDRSSGTLFIIATPIGNLGDITLRALDTLKNVDLIACEDTRHTRKLTQHYGVSTHLISYHQHNKIQKTDYIIKKLKEGKSVGLVSDAGTPGISDPGYFIVKKCIEEGISVEPIPGASAFTAALSISGFPTKEFVFQGFLPVKKGKRKKILKGLSQQNSTSALYISPYNIEKILLEIFEIFDERKIMIARELTKKFEEKIYTATSKLPDVFKDKKPKGEFTLLIAPPNF